MGGWGGLGWVLYFVLNFPYSVLLFFHKKGEAKGRGSR